jgi:hypothetical protein
MQVVLDRERSIALVAGQRNIADANMSEKALAERDAFEADNYGHQGEIVAKPTVKRYDNPGRSNVAKVDGRRKEARAAKAAENGAAA